MKKIKEVRNNRIIDVKRVWEKIYEKMKEVGRK